MSQQVRIKTHGTPNKANEIVIDGKDLAGQIGDYVLDCPVDGLPTLTAKMVCDSGFVFEGPADVTLIISAPPGTRLVQRIEVSPTEKRLCFLGEEHLEFWARQMATAAENLLAEMNGDDGENERRLALEGKLRAAIDEIIHIIPRVH